MYIYIYIYVNAPERPLFSLTAPTSAGRAERLAGHGWVQICFSVSIYIYITYIYIYLCICVAGLNVLIHA